VAYNPEINWKTEEVKMTRCPPLCGGRSQKKEKIKRVATEEEEKIVRWAIDDKEDWGREEEIEEDHRKIEEMVLKLPQMSPVFFVGKKDGSKWMVMDYHNLNSQTVKNNYPLPLITELIDNIGGKKVFMKMDLR